MVNRERRMIQGCVSHGNGPASQIDASRWPAAAAYVARGSWLPVAVACVVCSPASASGHRPWPALLGAVASASAGWEEEGNRKRKRKRTYCGSTKYKSARWTVGRVGPTHSTGRLLALPPLLRCLQSCERLRLMPPIKRYEKALASQPATATSSVR